MKATRISCFLYYGDYATKRSARIEIKVEVGVASGVALELYIAKVANPIIAGVRSNVQLKVTRECRLDKARCPVEITNAFYTT